MAAVAVADVVEHQQVLLDVLDQRVVAAGVLDLLEDRDGRGALVELGWVGGRDVDERAGGQEREEAEDDQAGQVLADEGEPVDEELVQEIGAATRTKSRAAK